MLKYPVVIMDYSVFNSISYCYIYFEALLSIDYAKAFGCLDHNKLENSERHGNTRPPDVPLEKPVCRSGSNS